MFLHYFPTPTYRVLLNPKFLTSSLVLITTFSHFHFCPSILNNITGLIPPSTILNSNANLNKLQFFIDTQRPNTTQTLPMKGPPPPGSPLPHFILVKANTSKFLSLICSFCLLVFKQAPSAVTSIFPNFC